MKNILLIIAFLGCFAVHASAETQTSPEPILPITRVDKPLLYYQEQANLWEAEISKDETNATAWWNYFKAARYANMKSKTSDKPFDLDKIAAQVSAAIPDSSENHYIQYIQDGRGRQSFDHLLKAYEIAPERPDYQESMANYHEINFNKEKLRQVMQRIFDTKDYSPGALKWNYNMLMSVEENGILLTWADNDTYPSWILQLVQNVRPDITIINTSLITGFNDYRKTVFERADIPAFGLTLDEVGNYDDYSVQLIEHICRKSQRPVYLASTIRPIVRDKLHGDLFMTGLAFKYSAESFDNIAVIKNNYENKFLKDYLTVNFEKETSEQVVNVMNLNYLPALLRLYKHYEAAGETTKATDLKKVIKSIAIKGERWEDISTYLGENQKEETINSMIRGRDIDRGFVKIKGNLYAMDTEMVNERYEAFLMDLLKNKEYEKLQKAKNEKVNWRELLPDSFKDIDDKELFGHGHPDNPNMPVYNVSYEGAQLYCQWMTQVYNQSDDRKKRYNKVLFRLPTQAEWEYAAHGGHQTPPYPWGGYYVTNAKGCFLFNSDALNLKNSDGVFKDGVEPCKDCPVNLGDFKDGGFFQVIADAYFPNDYGLYNMSGNLAEMVDTKGIAMGGSWANPPEECKVTSKSSYDGPSPSVGFRVFMEVKEYKK